MAGRDEPLGALGRPVGESHIIQNRKAQTVVHEFQEGWTIVAARVGTPVNRARFRAIIWRCILGADCKRYRCLGHGASVLTLAEKIRKTYA